MCAQYTWECACVYLCLDELLNSFNPQVFSVLLPKFLIKALGENVGEKDKIVATRISITKYIRLDSRMKNKRSRIKNMQDRKYQKW